MTEKNTLRLKRLTAQFKEYHAKAAEMTQAVDELKNEIKEIVGDAEYANDDIKVSHLTKKVIDYKGMVIDSQVKIPDSYKSTRTETRITIPKKKVSQEPEFKAVKL